MILRVVTSVLALLPSIRKTGNFSFFKEKPYTVGVAMIFEYSHVSGSIEDRLMAAVDILYNDLSVFKRYVS